MLMVKHGRRTDYLTLPNSDITGRELRDEFRMIGDEPPTMDAPDFIAYGASHATSSDLTGAVFTSGHMTRPGYRSRRSA